MVLAVEAIYESNKARSQTWRQESHRKSSRGRNNWHEFMISSLNDGAWQENNRGLVRIEEEAEIKASEAILKRLNTPHSKSSVVQSYEQCRLQLRPNILETARGRINIR